MTQLFVAALASLLCDSHLCIYSAATCAAASCTHLDGKKRKMAQSRFELAPAHDLMLNHSVAGHSNSQSDICQKETRVKVEREDMQFS